jgi:hypothetical protein
MKQSAYKNFMLFKPRTKYPCKKCRCSYKVVGDTWLEVKKPMYTEHGIKTFRVVWVCHSGHKVFRGYSKPIDWSKKLGGNMKEDDGKTYAEETNEIEAEYQEMVNYAKKMKNSGGGKLYY